ncbi:hypothetical protein [uncultured Vibrio sp.]|uniref:hypothetical protein n=1 Tax=uncultured Vibrio sp. TaxID=114054 RepID=UPI0025EC7B4A|nr:hypothetical protein [uncultured Vibrio sp.]
MGQLALGPSTVISVYLGALVITSLLYPFFVAGISLTFCESRNLKPYVVKFSVAWLTMTLSLILMHFYSLS